MAENSNIEWTDHTVNLWWGCAKVHTGCKNCYAEYFSDKRYKNNLWGEKSNRKRIKSWFNDLKKYQDTAFKSNTYQKVFIGSMMDIFEHGKPLENPNNTWINSADLRKSLFREISDGLYNNIRFLFLTKRPENITLYLPNEWWDNPPRNVWFGTSVSDQETAKYSEILFQNTPINSNRFLSIEPQVGDIWSINLQGIKWVIQGGESGHKKRPFELHWAYDMKRMCKESNVAYFFKQIDKIQEIPDDLFVREFPDFEI